MASCTFGLQLPNSGFCQIASAALSQHASKSAQIQFSPRFSDCMNFFSFKGPRVAKLVAHRAGVRCHAETEVLDSTSRAACPALKAEIDISAFSAVDLRVGLITDAKTVSDRQMSAKRGKPTDSRRYLQLTVDIGCETRTVVSDCRYVMDVEDAVGKKVLVVANVPPAEIHGIRSHGLVLTGVNYDPTPMARSFKVILPGLGRLPPGSQVAEAIIPQ